LLNIKKRKIIVFINQEAYMIYLPLFSETDLIH